MNNNDKGKKSNIRSLDWRREMEASRKNNLEITEMIQKREPNV